MGHLAAVHGERVQCDMCDFQGIAFSFNLILKVSISVQVHRAILNLSIEVLT